MEEWRATGKVDVSMPLLGLSTILIALFDGLGLELQAISGLAKEEETWTAFRASIVRLLS
jgi:hypothetical protein